MFHVIVFLRHKIGGGAKDVPIHIPTGQTFCRISR